MFVLPVFALVFAVSFHYSLGFVVGAVPEYDKIILLYNVVILIFVDAIFGH